MYIFWGIRGRNMTVITLAKLVVSLAIALRPLAPPKTYAPLFETTYTIIGIILLVGLAAYVDVILGFLLLTLVVSVSIAHTE
jgi:hypothetical protein